MTLPARALAAARRAQHGAALLVAMILLTLIATIAGGMIWQQHRAIQVEAAERARNQAAWILNGALDWALLVLKEDAKADARSQTGPSDGFDEFWATPFAEARLSTFLAADQNNNAEDDSGGPEAFLSGAITDMQSRYNLLRLWNGNGLDQNEYAALQRLCSAASVAQSSCQRIADGIVAIQGNQPGAPLMPPSVRELTWLGVDPADIKRLEPFVTLLPVPTPVNVNTASKEVIAAVLNINLADAQQWVQAQKPARIKSLQAAMQLPGGNAIPQSQVGPVISVNTQYFEVTGRVRLGDRVLQQRSLIQRKNAQQLDVLTREWVNLISNPG